MNLFYKPTLAAAFLGLALIGCKAPMATKVNGQVKQAVPEHFQNESGLSQRNTGMTPWREFFTDKTLQGLIETALANNQDLLKTYQEIEIARSNVMYRSGRLSPEVSAGLGQGVRKAGRYTSEGAGDAGTQIVPGKETPDPLFNTGGGLSMNWEVDIWHKLRTEKESAVAHYLSTVEGKNFILSSLIAEVADNYYELLALDNQLDIVHRYIEINERALEISKILKQASAGTELGVKKFEAELAKSKAQEYMVKQSIAEKENQINALLGRFPQSIERDKSGLVSAVPSAVYSGIPAQLLSNRPDIRAAEYELKSAQLDVEAARKEFYPSLGISATLGLEAFKPNYLLKMPESLAYNLAGELAGPLINKSAIKANFATADARQLQALYEYDKTIINAYVEVANLMSKIQNIGHYYELKSQETHALEESIEVANLLFKNSRADYLEVLMNNRDILDAKMEMVEAKKNQLTAVTDIYKSLGGGWQ
ncbi:efflux transporter outer membrane subunit [Bergeyella sp. RCAD1439]|nr:efflux transporter outer membrane subunit [Bergeyella sp. RCAD1439]